MNTAIETCALSKRYRRASPTSGTASFLGGAPRQDPAFLAEIGRRSRSTTT